MNKIFFYRCYIRLPTPHCYLVRRPPPQVSRYNSPPKLRRWPASLSAPRSEARHDCPATALRLWIERMKPSRRQRKLQDGWTTEDCSSTPAPDRQDWNPIDLVEYGRKYLAHPRNPRATVESESHLPCWL